jgi:polyphosphate kinase
MTVALDHPSLYLNRELSLIAFHRRVLTLAADRATPLLERLRFLTIVSRIVDEFYEVRVAGLLQGATLELRPPGPDGLARREVLARIAAEMQALVAEQYRVLNDEVLPALAAEGVRLPLRANLSPRLTAWARRYFEEQALPVLTPLGLDTAHPFPNVQNKGLNFIVSLEGQDAFGRPAQLAIVQVPRCLPRLIRVPPGVAEAPYEFMMLSTVIQAGVDLLFPGLTVRGCHPFRVTRNSELWVDEEESDDLLRALEMELPRRNYGDAVRLEVGDACSDGDVELLLHQFGLERTQLFRVSGPVNLHRLAPLPDLVDRPELRFPAFTPRLPVPRGADLFRELRRGELLLHHPYESFAPVLDLLRQAADDPAVLAIKMTLYRTGHDSPVVDSLVEAARAGKAVTVVVELRARFDEAANIRLATRLQEAGATVVYGVVGYKAHCKMLLVLRREGESLRRYVHLGTGNYHTTTARLYTDLGLMTCDPAIGRDVHLLFGQLTGLQQAAPLEKVLASPFHLAESIVARIDAEAEAARAGRPSGVRARLNSLIDPGVIQALYRASQAGVPIDLMVRSLCRLRPGVPGVSETIRVRSTVGRFLEHARAFAFVAGGRDEVFLSSADWMERNLHRRVEVAFPVGDPALKARVLREAFALYDREDPSTWELQADGRWRRLGDGGGGSAQAALLRERPD